MNINNNKIGRANVTVDCQLKLLSIPDLARFRFRNVPLSTLQMV